MQASDIPAPVREAKAKLDGDRLRYRCPCGHEHGIRVGLWQWNGSLESPTITPSVLVTYNGDDAGAGGVPHAACHSFVTGGHAHFCSDCSHDLRGQTVELPTWREQ